MPTFVTRNRTQFGAGLLLVLVVLWTGVMTAWVSDDAQITFRQVWNWVNGDGITFNYGERVQAFSHPLWFLVLSGIALVTGELYLSTLIANISFAVLAVGLLLIVEHKVKQLARLLSPAWLLIFSVAFCDYMSAGLENALSCFLIGVLLWLLVAGSTSQPLRCWLFLVLAMLVLNRFDYAVLFLPLAMLLAITPPHLQGNTRTVICSLCRDLWPGVTLIGLWLGFATIYFGSPLPNTFYAKMMTGYPVAEVLARGADYFLVQLEKDPLTLLIILIAIVWSCLSRNRVLQMLALGQILYLGFIISAGGDFMQGRFFAVPMYLAIGQLILVLAEGNFGATPITEQMTDARSQPNTLNKANFGATPITEQMADARSQPNTLNKGNFGATPITEQMTDARPQPNTLDKANFRATPTTRQMTRAKPQPGTIGKGSHNNRFGLSTGNAVVLGLLGLAVVLGQVGYYPFVPQTDYNDSQWVANIADERGVYYRRFGLMSARRKSWPQLQPQPDTPPDSYQVYSGGMGKFSLPGPQHYLIDECALTSVFLARLPAVNPMRDVDLLRDYWQDPKLYQLFGVVTPAISTKYSWRIGHHFRALPAGYEEFVTGDRAALPDPKLNSLLQDVTLLTTGEDLFARDRLAAIWRLHTGYHSD